MSYTVELQLTNIAESGSLATSTKNNWSGTITSDNEAGYFIAVVSNTLPENTQTRVITVQMHAMQSAPKENDLDIGCFERKESEAGVKVILLDQTGKEVATSSDYVYP